MKITLYKTVSENIRLNKELTNEHILNGTLKDSSSVLTPTILIQTNPMDYNYAYIPIFNRYYYITNIIAVRANAFIINLKCDVLMSYKDNLLELSGVVSRLTDGSEYADRNIVVSCKSTKRRIEFTDVFSDKENYVLITQGSPVLITDDASGGSSSETSGDSSNTDDDDNSGF